MILIDVHTGLLLALEGHTGAGGLGQTVNIVCLDAQGFLNIPAHLVGPGLRTEDARLQFVILRLVSHFLQGFADVGGIRGGAAKDRGAQIHHKLDLAIRVAGGHGERQTSHLVGAAVQTGTAGEQTVAVGYLANIFLGAAHGHDGTGTAIFPQIHVVLGVERYHAAAGGAGGGLDAYAVGQGLGQKSVGVLIPQIGFGEEGQLMQILHATDVVGSQPLFLHQGAIVGHVVPYVAHLFTETFALQRPHLLIRHGFDFFLIVLFAHMCIPLLGKISRCSPGQMPFCSVPQRREPRWFRWRRSTFPPGCPDTGQDGP